MDRRLDPRSIVTPYAFAVHPDLLGMPLATPWQRLGAILVDLVIIGFVSQIGLGPLAVGFAGLLFWMAVRKPSRDVLGKFFRVAVGCLGTGVLLTTLVVVWVLRHADEIKGVVGEIENRSSPQVGTGSATEAPEETGGAGTAIVSFIGGFRGAVDLQRAETQAEAQELMNEIASGATRAGLDSSQVRDLLGELIPEGAAWSSDPEVMVNSAIAQVDKSQSEAEGPVEAEAPAEPGGPILSSAAGDSIARLREALQRAEDERADLARSLERTSQDLEAAREGGVFAWLRDIIDELGIGFGWGALYLTVTHAWWNGTSIGKKLFHIRVVMIDKRPLNWWLSFERAGGYAAGLATGLLGFAQVFWDPNRQAIHDKVSETIVIQDGMEPVPGPWIEEGKAQWKKGGEQQGSPRVPIV